MNETTGILGVTHDHAHESGVREHPGINTMCNAHKSGVREHPGINTMNETPEPTKRKC